MTIRELGESNHDILAGPSLPDYAPAGSAQMRAIRMVRAARKRRTLEKSAPKLLEAANKILAAMEYVRDAMPLDRKGADQYLVISEAIQLARAAIAKAEGR